MERRPCVLAVGDVMNDIVVRPEGPLVLGADRRASIRALPGGSGANQAAWLAACGVDVRFAGRAGRTDHAAQVKLLEEAGVVALLAFDEALPTGTIVALISPDGERSFLTDRGANEGLCRVDLPDALLDGADLLHISGYSLFASGPRDAAMRLMREAMRRNIPVSVDAASHSFLEEAGAENFLIWTRGARFCFANAAEAAVLVGTPAIEEQLARLARNYEVVAIKGGRDGAAAAAHGRYWTKRRKRRRSSTRLARAMHSRRGSSPRTFGAGRCRTAWKRARELAQLQWLAPAADRAFNGACLFRPHPEVLRRSLSLEGSAASSVAALVLRGSLTRAPQHEGGGAAQETMTRRLQEAVAS